MYRPITSMFNVLRVPRVPRVPAWRPARTSPRLVAPGGVVPTKPGDAAGKWMEMAGVGNCPILGHHLIVAIIDHIPNGWVMFNGDI